MLLLLPMLLLMLLLLPKRATSIVAVRVRTLQTRAAVAGAPVLREASRLKTSSL